MDTKAGDPGAFAHFDLSSVDSPAFWSSMLLNPRDLAILGIKARSGAKILLAMKAFSMWDLAPLIGEYLDGVRTSGLWEARLAGEKYRAK